MSLVMIGDQACPSANLEGFAMEVAPFGPPVRGKSRKVGNLYIFGARKDSDMGKRLMSPDCSTIIHHSSAPAGVEAK